MDRRTFVKALSGGTLAVVSSIGARPTTAVAGGGPGPQGLVEYVESVSGGWDPRLYARLLGAANEPKEGDVTVGVAAATDPERRQARQLLAATRLRDVDAHPPFEDGLYRSLKAGLDPQAQARTAGWTFAELKAFLLGKDQAAIE